MYGNPPVAPEGFVGSCALSGPEAEQLIRVPLNQFVLLDDGSYALIRAIRLPDTIAAILRESLPEGVIEEV